MYSFLPLAPNYRSYRLLSYFTHLLRNYVFLSFGIVTNGHRIPVAYNNKDLFPTHVTRQLQVDDGSATALFNSTVFPFFLYIKTLLKKPQQYEDNVLAQEKNKSWVGAETELTLHWHKNYFLLSFWQPQILRSFVNKEKMMK